MQHVNCCLENGLESSFPTKSRYKIRIDKNKALLVRALPFYRLTLLQISSQTDKQMRILRFTRLYFYWRSLTERSFIVQYCNVYCIIIQATESTALDISHKHLAYD